MSGLFITFEGIEGCGKSTQVEAARAHLEAAGRNVLVTREPGGTAISEAIRAILLSPANRAMAPTAELMLYEAARAQLVAEVIRPALESGTDVICDRFADSSTAYQGAGRGLRHEDLLPLHELATAGTWPDRSILLDLPVAEGLARVQGRGAADRIEQESLAFHERVRQAFLDLARREPDRFRIIDGARDASSVAASVLVAIDELVASKASE